ncbi:phage tail assembly chaperone G [Sporosarcina sp. A2]|uniref:phage tail assembly chaperone G n=1 Tax=Sporosarcina sp. A2 TaxID=3393449 RepID=UPI003D79FDF1
MANLKRNTITLVKEVKEGEVITETYLTPAFVPLSIVYEANDVSEYVFKEEDKKSERERFEKMIEFTVSLYGNQFNKEDLTKGLHGPEAIEVLTDQLMFAANGIQDEATKKFLAKKR